MKKNMYDVTRLATLYFPDSTERNARRRLFKVLRAERDLWARLTALHFGVWQRTLHPANTKWSSTSSANRRRRTTTSASGRTNRPAIHRQEAPWKTGENAHFQAETDGNVHERAIMHTPVFGDTYLCIVIRMTRELQNQKTNF